MPVTTLKNAIAYEEWIREADGDFAWKSFDENTAAGMCYTSGTTGHPKGVLYSHRSNVLHSMMAAMPDAMGVSSRDMVMPVVPMFHANCWGLALTSPMLGAGLVMPGARLDGASIYELLDTYKVSFTAAEIAEITQSKATRGATQETIRGLASLNDASSGDLSFLGNSKYRGDVAATRASVVLLPPDYAGEPQGGQLFLLVDNPSVALARVCSRIEQQLWPKPAPGIHPSASVAASAQIAVIVACASPLALSTVMVAFTSWTRRSADRSATVLPP
jgi:hypothetical protein